MTSLSSEDRFLLLKIVKICARAGSSVGIVTGLWAGRFGVRIQATKNFSVFPNVPDPASYLMGTGVTSRDACDA